MVIFHIIHFGRNLFSKPSPRKLWKFKIRTNLEGKGVEFKLVWMGKGRVLLVVCGFSLSWSFASLLFDCATKIEISCSFLLLCLWMPFLPLGEHRTFHLAFKSCNMSTIFYCLNFHIWPFCALIMPNFMKMLRKQIWLHEMNVVSI